MVAKKRPKAEIVLTETLDDLGRYVKEEEYKWILNQFKDRYHPIRLSLGLMWVCGLRREDACRCRFKWFKEDFSYIQMPQCKAHQNKKDGVVHIKAKARFVPLADWLREDIRAFVKYRLAVGMYIGNNIDEFRLFPKLIKENCNSWLSKLRKKHPEAKFLRDIWQIIKHYDKEGNLIHQQIRYRIAPHAGRVYYTTCAYKVCNQDPIKGRYVSGHERVKDFERYAKVSGVMEAKDRIKKEYMDKLCPEQKTPLLIGQKNLKEFGFSI